MAIKLHNTLGRKKQVFEPNDPGRVGMYVCGMTVYDYAHIGNARPMIVFDVLFRLLRNAYGDEHVKYVRNITDVDDKINARAQEADEDIAAITARTIEAFHEDMDAVGVLRPTEEPRATDHIAQMIAMIEKLIDGGFAYEAEGHVLFDVESDPEYGVLSGRSVDEMIAGARVEVAPYKRNPADFVLWKPSSDDLPGWDSPWGRGRPGWHIECSAMGEEHLGETFDIHGGGIDLVFPHHENEVSQSACAHGGKPLANYWVHNGFLVVEGEKMSKSLGNFFTVRDLLANWDGEVLRYTMLSAHYRQPLDWTNAGMQQAKQSLDRLYTALRGLQDVEATGGDIPEGVLSALEDDLNTPLAQAALHELAGEANRAQTAEEKQAVKGQLLAGAALMGLLTRDPEEWFKAGAGDDAVEIDALIAARNQARADKDFARADEIRDELAAQGIILEDGPSGTTWKRG